MTLIFLLISCSSKREEKNKAPRSPAQMKACQQDYLSTCSPQKDQQKRSQSTTLQFKKSWNQWRCREQAIRHCTYRELGKNLASGWHKVKNKAKTMAHARDEWGKKVIHFWNFLRHHWIKLKNLRPHAVGLGATVSASFVGSGVKLHYEFMSHKGKIGLFCAPGAHLQTELVGVGLAGSIIKTINCSSNQHYEGQFITLGIGLGAELIGVPLGAGIAYSVGINFNQFLNQLNLAIQNDEINIKHLRSELEELSVQENSETTSTESFILRLVLSKIVGAHLALDEIKNNLILTYKKLKSVDYHPKSMETVVNGELKQQEHRTQFPEYIKSLTLLKSSLSGCDAFTAQAGFSISLSPIDLSLSGNNYKLIGEMSREDIQWLDQHDESIGQMLWRNKIHALYSLLKIAPKYYHSHAVCMADYVDIVLDDFRNLLEILRSY